MFSSTSKSKEKEKKKEFITGIAEVQCSSKCNIADLILYILINKTAIKITIIYY